VSNVVEFVDPRTKSEQVIRIEELTDGTTYIGWAPTGTTTSASKWRLLKMVESGTDTTVQWADGDKKYNNIWNNRASLTYS